ncbi:hypothetical protein P20311_2652 [Pseudoalteromonas sp. BSi20311]|jgi:hypothetical protein|uniref:DUF2937 family protein n=1 Tax=unclassified Pseudoalteromonas TaxID=194690 RepID=UPI000231976A|nr:MULTISPECIES: DUF2937 family protein [unclassified Pseudoalteromonas]GAA64849.1 hypothetical protein P20311_2652 [Pseudoalteromonas sp. BSi20311]GAA70184.1 hypothetical protein P20439_0246 [Pseudoalteromonas sp. BSi20439]
MIVNLFDKLIFACAFIVSLQLPQLSDHYQQHLAGLYHATKWQVDGYADTAEQYNFSSTQAMIKRHLANTEPSVRADAKQKQQTLLQFADLKKGMAIFEQGNLVQKMLYMFSPERFDRLQNTLNNFKLGIPLTASAVLFALVLAILLNQLLMLPHTLYVRRKKRIASDAVKFNS